MEKVMEVLVSEIQKRNVLWDKSSALYKDRLTADKEWDEVTKIVGISKHTAKKKWRNLRDHFFKELKRIPKSKEDDAATYYPGKWKFFRRLLFLKDTITPTDNDGRFSPTLEHSNFTIIKPEVESEEDSLIEPEMENEDSKSKIELKENGTEISFNEKPPTATNESLHRIRKRKRLDMELNGVNLQLLDIEAKKLAILEASEDENSLYLRSLAPFLRKMDPIRQLRVRTKFQEILLKEMEEMKQHNNLTLNDLSSAYSDISAPASTNS